MVECHKYCRKQENKKTKPDMGDVLRAVLSRAVRLNLIETI